MRRSQSLFWQLASAPSVSSFDTSRRRWWPSSTRPGQVTPPSRKWPVCDVTHVTHLTHVTHVTHLTHVTHVTHLTHATSKSQVAAACAAASRSRDRWAARPSTLPYPHPELTTQIESRPSQRLHAGYMPVTRSSPDPRSVTCRSHAGYMPVTCRSHAGYLPVTRRLPAGDTPVTRRLHAGYMPITCRLHDRVLTLAAPPD